MIVFIDDFRIYSKIEDEHDSHLRLDLQVLKEHQLYAKFNKCEFLLRSVSFLGHIISCDTIEVHSKKTDATKIGIDLCYHRHKKFLGSIRLLHKVL